MKKKELTVEKREKIRQSIGNACQYNFLVRKGGATNVNPDVAFGQVLSLFLAE